MTLDTNTDVEEIRKVQDEAGDKQPPANQAEQARTNRRLGNHDGLTQFVYSTDSSNAESLDSYAVPNGVEVLIEYAESNTGTVYVGDSDTQQSPLTSAGQARTFRVTDTSAVYVRTPDAGDSVVVTFEVSA